MLKALIVDDEKPVRQVIAALGEWKKYGVAPPCFACDGSDALQSMREVQPDIVFVDMEMPVLSGAEFIKQASKEFPQTIFIVVSGYDDYSYTRIAIQQGVLDYLLKPIDGEELNQILGKAVDRLNAAHGDASQEEAPANHLTINEILTEIQDYVDAHYTTDINLDYFSQKYFFRREYLTRMFKQKYGMGIYEYALTQRMERAKVLLLDETLQVQEIAERLGYADSHYFSKAFKNYFGDSPSAFRKGRVPNA